jgi:hypothetical protein
MNWLAREDMRIPEDIVDAYHLTDQNGRDRLLRYQ